MDMLIDELDKQFPNAPFNISCIDNLEELDSVFTFEPVIFIHDGRAKEHNYYYENIDSFTKSKYIHYLKIEAKDEYITLRQIINEMINDAHYHDTFVKGDPHNLLEGFDQLCKLSIQYTCFFGS